MAKTDRTEPQGKQTTVEEGTQFKGTLHSSCPVVVRGVVDGDLMAPSIIVSESGTVVGNVKADTIRSEGVLAGRVDAEDVYLSGSVRSDTIIRAKTLEVKLQRQNDKLEVTFGECVLEVGDDPEAEKSDAASAHVHRSVAQTATHGPEDRANENGRSHGSADGEPTTDRRSVPPPPS
jgi:cytoskeletal protein CcmA (bactofilin family)